jgi:hypothetical protein
MISFTPEQQLANLKLALRLWQERANPDNVDLNDWCHFDGPDGACGSTACFGGHLATWPEFQAMGVIPDPESGAPRFADDPESSSFTVSRVLFGNSSLFDPRHAFADGDDAWAQTSEGDLVYTDYDLVQLRLQRRISQLELAGFTGTELAPA